MKEHQWQRFVEQDAPGLVRIKKHGDMHVDAMMVADIDDVMHKGDGNIYLPYTILLLYLQRH